MKPTRDSQNTVETWRIRAFTIAAGIIFLIFVGRLFSLQILQREVFLERAQDNRTQEIIIPTRRGVIFDRNGIILARNIASYNILITPALLPDAQGMVDQILDELSYLTGVPLSKGSLDEPLIPCGDNLGINEMVAIQDSFAPYAPVKIKCNVPKEIAMIIQERSIDWPGVSVEIEPVREYPTGSLTAALIGFLGPIPASREEEFRLLGFDPSFDKTGYAGIELYFDEQLRGQNGLRIVEVDVAGQVLRDIEPPLDPIPGNNPVLSIDTRLQQVAEAILTSELEAWNLYLGRTLSNNGVVIVMNPSNGEILAMVSYPSYENNRLAREIPFYYWDQLTLDAHEPLINHAISAERPPGSVFKLATAVGALNEGVVSPTQIIQTPPFITVTEKFFASERGNEREFVDWFDPGFGELDFIHGLANSSNVYFYKLGGGYEEEVPDGGLGICRLGTYARAIGYGDLTGINLPGEAIGLIGDPTWKRINQGETWSTGNTYNASVGQGLINATPLQVLMSAATIANDGVLMQPTILREIIDDEGNVIETYDPVIIRDITQDAVIDVFDDPTGPGGCESKKTGEQITVQPWVIDLIQQGMRLAVTEGTLEREFEGVTITVAGKTGTAEYCDPIAQEKNLCIPGNWPTHAWTVAYAPFDDPEIVVIAFVYNGGEGASVAGPIVRRVIEAYFELKAIDVALAAP